MARIPTPVAPGQEVGSVKQQFTATPFQNINAPIEAFGSNQAKALAAASDGLDAFADVMATKAKDDDALTALENDNSLATFNQDLMHNPTTGILASKQKGAINSSKRAMAAFDAHVSTLPEPTTDAARVAQKQKLLKMKATILQQAATHERLEVTKYKTGQVNSAIGNAQQSMQSNWNNPTILKNEESVIRAQSQNAADFQELDKESADELIEQNVSAGYSKAISSAVASQDYLGAKKMLDKAIADNKLQPDDRDKALREVQTATVLGEGQAAADKIMAAPDLTDEQRRNEAKNIKDPMIREKAMALVVSDINAKETFRKREISDRFDAAVLAAREGRPVTANMTSGFDDDQLQHIDKVADEQKNLTADPDFKRVGDGGGTMGKFREAAIIPGKLAGMTYTQLQAAYETGVTKDQFDQIIYAEWYSAKQAVNKTTISDEKELQKKLANINVISDMELLKKTAQAAGIDVSAKKGDDIDRWLAWQREYNVRVKEANAITKEQREVIINKMARDVVVYDTRNVSSLDLFENEAYAFELTESNLDDFAYELVETEGYNMPKSDVPIFKKFYPDVSSSLRASGQTINRETISKEYSKMRNLTKELPQSQQVQFMQNYAVLTRFLVSKNIPLSMDNYMSVWATRVAAQ